ncbi:TPA: glycosyltransferase family 2 protein [Photobacterium damselae]
MKPDNTRASLAVALIVKNEEKHLAACLDSVKDWVDEIVILDSGSSDATEEIARQYTNKFYVSEDWPGFGIQRQRAQAFVESDYILWLDADERVTPELMQEIQRILKNKPEDKIYYINRLSVFLDKKIAHSGWYPDFVARLYKTKSAQYDSSLVHEKVFTNELKTEKLHYHLIHYPYNNLQHYLDKSVKYAEYWSNDRYKKGKTSSILSAIIHSLSCFIKMYFIKKGFLDGKQGLILALLSAMSCYNKYLLLWEMSIKNDK